MPAPLSLDLRESIIEARSHYDVTYEQLAEIFGVGRATVSRLLHRQRETGGVEPGQLGGARKEHLISDNDLLTLESIVDETPDKTLSELVEVFEAHTGVRVSRATMGRAVERAGLTRKKNVPGRAARKGGSNVIARAMGGASR